MSEEQVFVNTDRAYLMELEQKAKDSDYFRGRVESMEYVIDALQEALKGKVKEYQDRYWEKKASAQNQDMAVEKADVNYCDNDKKMKKAQICIALPPQLLVYLKIMTKMRDLSYSDYVKGLIEDDLSKNIDIYKKALEIRNNI